jgi:hypothetical protein
MEATLDEGGSCCGMFYSTIIAITKKDFGNPWNIDVMVMLESCIYISSGGEICWKPCYRRVIWELQ